MAGDYSKFSFRRERRVGVVEMQQGRVQTDADFSAARICLYIAFASLN